MLSHSHAQALRVCQIHREYVSARRHVLSTLTNVEMNNETLVEMSENAGFDSIYFNRLSFYSAKLSAGGAIDTCRAVMSGTVKNALAVIRPPGHHAEISNPMGFCLFNNTGIATKVCQQDFGQRCRKVLILDWYVTCPLSVPC